MAVSHVIIRFRKRRPDPIAPKFIFLTHIGSMARLTGMSFEARFEGEDVARRIVKDG